MRRLVEKLKRDRPDIVFVALGCPKQERLIVSVRHQLPASWWLGIGISFSFVCGAVKRAPKWMQGIGMEWAHRLAQEPRRLARRYLLDGMPFACRLLTTSALRRNQVAGSR
jgi:N-acetylglucosaminyldiphosphoundecaprenol N-acetyl-beta-D-mannosaminyltransferase